MSKIKIIGSSIYTFILISIGWFLGALGGSSGGNKAFRRFALPILITGLAYLDLESIFVLTILSMCGCFSIGYGLPGPGDPKPSKLGEFFLNLCKQNKFWANTLTRTVIGILVCLSLVSIPIIKHNWLIYGFCMVGIILTYALLSWRDLGTYYLFKKPLLWQESILYGLITIFSILIIKLG